MSAPQGYDIGPVGLDLSAGAKKRRIATLKIRRNSHFRILPLIQQKNKLESSQKISTLPLTDTK